MSRLAEIYKYEKGKGGGLGSTLKERAKEKYDPRQFLDQKGFMTALLPILKAYKSPAKRPYERKTELASTSPLGTGAYRVLENIQRNTSYLPVMARDTNIMKQNIGRLVKVFGETPREKAEKYFERGRLRENEYESKFVKNAGVATGTAPTKTKEGEKKSFLSGLLSTLTSLFSVKGLLITGLVSAIVLAIREYFKSEEFRKKVDRMVGDLFGTLKEFAIKHWKEILVGIAILNPLKTLSLVLTGINLFANIFSPKSAFMLALAGIAATIGAGKGFEYFRERKAELNRLRETSKERPLTEEEQARVRELESTLPSTDTSNKLAAAGAVGAAAVAGSAAKDAYKLMPQTKDAILDARTNSVGAQTGGNIKSGARKPLTKWGRFLLFLEARAPKLWARIGVRLMLAAPLLAVPVAGWIIVAAKVLGSLWLAWEVYEFWLEFNKEDIETKPEQTDKENLGDVKREAESAIQATKSGTTAGATTPATVPSTTPSVSTGTPSMPSAATAPGRAAPSDAPSQNYTKGSMLYRVSGKEVELPVEKGELTSPRGFRSFRDKTGATRQGFHMGVDIGVGVGTPVYCPENGLIVSTIKVYPSSQIPAKGTVSPGYGGPIYVILSYVKTPTKPRHKLMHLSALGDGIKQGARVNKGDLIGYSGDAGTGPHLHWEVWENGKDTDPLQALKTTPNAVPGKEGMPSDVGILGEQNGPSIAPEPSAAAPSATPGGTTGTQTGQPSLKQNASLPPKKMASAATGTTTNVPSASSTTPTKASETGGKFDYEKYKDWVGYFEGGGKHSTPPNKLGYFGKYGIGAQALESFGYLKKGSFKKYGDQATFKEDAWADGWSLDKMLNTSEGHALQDKLMSDITNSNMKYLQKVGVIKEGMSGDEIASRLYAAHHGGAGGAANWFIRNKDTQDKLFPNASVAKSASKMLNAYASGKTPSTSGGGEIAAATPGQTPSGGESATTGTAATEASKSSSLSESISSAVSGILDLGQGLTEDILGKNSPASSILSKFFTDIQGPEAIQDFRNIFDNLPESTKNLMQKLGGASGDIFDVIKGGASSLGDSLNDASLENIKGRLGLSMAGGQTVDQTPTPQPQYKPPTPEAPATTAYAGIYDPEMLASLYYTKGQIYQSINV